MSDPNYSHHRRFLLSPSPSPLSIPTYPHDQAKVPYQRQNSIELSTLLRSRSRAPSLDRPNTARFLSTVLQRWNQEFLQHWVATDNRPISHRPSSHSTEEIFSSPHGGATLHMPQQTLNPTQESQINVLRYLSGHQDPINSSADPRDPDLLRFAHTDAFPSRERGKGTGQRHSGFSAGELRNVRLRGNLQDNGTQGCGHQGTAPSHNFKSQARRQQSIELSWTRTNLDNTPSQYHTPGCDSSIRPDTGQRPAPSNFSTPWDRNSRQIIRAGESHTIAPFEGDTHKLQNCASDVPSSSPIFPRTRSCSYLLTEYDDSVSGEEQRVRTRLSFRVRTFFSRTARAVSRLSLRHRRGSRVRGKG